MTYTKKEFGSELKVRLLQENSCDNISKWAFKVYIDQGLETENGLDDIMLKLIALEEGSEFVLPREELLALAEKLISG